jgi:LysM repeat protein
VTAGGAGPLTYQVQPGDTVFHLSRAFGVSEGALMDTNGIADPSRIYAGQTLVIPGAITASVPEADTPSSDASLTYTVQRGDTLSFIAARFGLDEDGLLAANRIANRNRIYAGQVVTLG